MVLTGKQRHELSCSGCGAPLHDIKVMPIQAKPKQTKSHSAPTRPQKVEKKKKKSKKSRKLRGFFEEAFDIIEDIFD